MPTSPAAEKTIRLVDTAAKLNACIKELSGFTELAFDLEFDSNRHAYGLTLCLIQMASPEACYVIEPMTGLDLRPLFDLFEDASVQKLAHSVGEDLRVLQAEGCFPKNIYDTETPARLLNYEQTSLAAMLQEKLGYAINKQQQRSNWLQRPLKPAQIEYAAADVAWLHALKAALEAEAIPKGLMPFVLEEQEALEKTVCEPEEKTYFLKTSDERSLSPYDQFLLNRLFLYREELARSLNRPAYQIFSEDTLRALADGSLLPSGLPDEKGVHRELRSRQSIAKMEAWFRGLYQEADSLELSQKREKRTRMDDESWTAANKARTEGELDKERLFAPVQRALAARFGEFAARYILSNRIVGDVVRGELRIGMLRCTYRQALVIGAARELGINLGRYV